MAQNIFVKAEKIATMGLGLLMREVVLPGVVKRHSEADFKGAADDSVKISIPARFKGRSHKMRAEGEDRKITLDVGAEKKVSIKLTDVLYHARAVTDEERTLDVVNFVEKVVQPSVRAVVEDTENLIYKNAIRAAKYADFVEWDLTAAKPKDAFKAISEVRRKLNDAFVPRSGRILLVGAAVEDELINDNKLDRKFEFGVWKGDALQESVIGQIAGFTVIGCPLLAPGEAYGYHPSAYVYANVAPVKPEGAYAGKSVSADSLGLLWTADYDSLYGTDRSMVKTFAGATAMHDGDKGKPKFTDGAKIANPSTGTDTDLCVRSVPLVLKTA